MNIDYTYGLSESLMISSVVSLLAIIVIFIFFINFRDEAGLGFILIWGTAFICIAIFLFCLIFPLANLYFLQDSLGLNFLQEELASGVFGLRTSSILMSLSVISTLIKINTDSKRENDLRSRMLINSQLGLPQETYDPLVVNLFQLAYYIVVIGVLWSVTISGIHTTSTTVLNWALFFIADDWNIIADYLHAYGGSIIFSHRLRIIGFNLLIELLLIYTIYSSFGSFLASIVTLITLIVLFGRHIAYSPNPTHRRLADRLLMFGNFRRIRSRRNRDFW